MDIDLLHISKAIDKMVNETVEQMDGRLNPTLPLSGARHKLGHISEFVLNLYDEIKELGDESLSSLVWEMKHRSDDLIEKILDEEEKAEQAEIENHDDMVRLWQIEHEIESCNRSLKSFGEMYKLEKTPELEKEISKYKERVQELKDEEANIKTSIL